MNRERTPRSNDRFSRTRSSGAPRYSGSGSGSGGDRRAAGFGGGPRRSGGPGRPGGGSGRRSASGVKGEFALPVTVTPALPAVETFGELEMPAPLKAALTTAGVTVPFPIQAATLPNSLA